MENNFNPFLYSLLKNVEDLLIWSVDNEVKLPFDYKIFEVLINYWDAFNSLLTFINFHLENINGKTVRLENYSFTNPCFYAYDGFCKYFN